jgi:chromosome partitioning protein
VEAEVRDYFGPGVVFERAVPVSVKFREAYARGIPLVHYDRLGAGARAYRAAAEAFLDGTRAGGSIPERSDTGGHDDNDLGVELDPEREAG